MNEEEVDELQDFNWELKPPYHKFLWAVIRSVGWYAIAIFFVVVYSWSYICNKWFSWKAKKDEKEYDAKYHKNVDLSSELLIATQLAREKMQEKYLKEREIALQKEQEKKERKKQEMLRLKNQDPTSYGLHSDGSESSSQSSSSKSSKLRADYNPLMGDSSKRYVPPKRSCCGKGGCG